MSPNFFALMNLHPSGVFDTIPYLIHFNKFEFCQKMIHSIFDSLLLPKNQFKLLLNSKKSTDSFQKKIQFNSQGIIDTGRIGKVPKD